MPTEIMDGATENRRARALTYSHKVVNCNTASALFIAVLELFHCHLDLLSTDCKKRIVKIAE